MKGKDYHCLLHLSSLLRFSILCWLNTGVQMWRSCMSTLNNNLEFQVLLLSKRYDSGNIDNAYANCATLCSSHCSEVMYFVVIIVILSKLLQMVVFRDVICSLSEYYQCSRGADCLFLQVHPFRLPSCVCLKTYNRLPGYMVSHIIIHQCEYPKSYMLYSWLG